MIYIFKSCIEFINSRVLWIANMDVSMKCLLEEISLTKGMYIEWIPNGKVIDIKQWIR